MVLTADDQDSSSLCGLFFHDPVDLFYIRTCGIDDLHSVFFQNVIDIFSDAVGTDHNNGIADRPQLFQSVDDLHSFFLKIPHDLFIVDDRTVGVDRFFRLSDLLIYFFHSTLHAKAEARCLCHCYFHVTHPAFSRSSQRSRPQLPSESCRSCQEAPHPPPALTENSPGAYPGSPGR